MPASIIRRGCCSGGRARGACSTWGAGSGSRSIWRPGWGGERWGVDPSCAAAAGREQLGADIRQAYLTEGMALGDGFERVIASEVIEHVTDPYAMLALLRGRLAPGGVLALTTPNAAAIEPGADQGRLIGILAPGVHLTLFTESSLAMTLRGGRFRACGGGGDGGYAGGRSVGLAAAGERGGGACRGISGVSGGVDGAGGAGVGAVERGRRGGCWRCWCRRRRWIR